MAPALGALWPLLLFVLSSSGLAPAPRETIPFDFGFRFVLGSGTRPPACDPSASFPRNISGFQCLGLTGVPGATTAAACAAAACAADADAWQLCMHFPGDCTEPCFVGPSSSCASPNPRFRAGGARVPQPLPPFDPSPAQPGFDDSAWAVVDTPHDALIASPYVATANNGEGSIPRNVSWYRKRFALPAEWEGSHVSVYIEGAFAMTRAFVNGEERLSHSHGYTSFAVRIDNATSVSWGGAANVLALFVDATETTGWWFEGGGLYRRTFLLRTDLVRVQDDGVFAPTFTTGAVHAHGTVPADGLVADSATVVPHVTVENHHAATMLVVVVTSLYSADGTTLVAASAPTPANVSGGGGSTAVSPPPFDVAGAELWSIARPYLYTLVASVFDGDGTTLRDSINITVGVRAMRFDADNGFFVNDEAVRIRGFCNHNNAGGVGMAVPARINLLRLQQLRGMGGNAWRMAHNAAEPATLELTDRLGVLVLDENRVASEAGLLAQDTTDLADMVRRDRSHASIFAWSFCNEGQCSPATQPTLDMKFAADALDGSRSVTANMFLSQVMESENASVIIDLQGFSHQEAGLFAAFHALLPAKPVMATECCGCKSQRGEDFDLPRNFSTAFYDNLGIPNESCIQKPQWAAAYLLRFSAGLFTWTSHDYIGEPNGWPHISASHGQFDLVAMPKAPSYWYRAKYLAAVPVADAGRPPLPVLHVCHIVESWQDNPVNNSRVIHVYASGVAVRLLLNGVPVPGGSVQPVVPDWALFPTVAFAPGTLTAEALAADGMTLATHSRISFGAPAAIVLSLDAPSLATGTGSALFLDGSDVALVRATVVDADGHVVMGSAAVNVSFSVTAGPGRVIGSGSGDPSDHNPNPSTWRMTYHGLARAIVRTTLDAATPDAGRARRIFAEIEAGVGSLSSAIMPVGGSPPRFLTVSATAPGLPVSTLVVMLSVDAADSPAAVAARSVATAAMQ